MGIQPGSGRPRDARGDPLMDGPAAPARLVDYADGSIVSRTLHRGAAGNLTVFAFDAGQELTEHTTPCDAHLLVLDGRAEVTVDGRTWPVGVGEMVRLPADRPHSVRAVERFKMLLTMIRG